MTISTKMAAVRSIASPLALAAVFLLGACTREAEDAPTSKAEAPADPAPAKAEGSAPAPATEVPPSSLGAGLDDALERAVVAPAAGGSNYRVDAFVAALVFAAVEREAERWFSPWAGTPAKVDYEVRGYTVTAAGERAGLMRLGLREGDIVEAINGVPATDSTTVRGALAGSDAGVTVGVFRDDYSFVLGYRFEPGLAWMRTREDAGIEAAGAAAVVAVADTGEGAGQAEDDGEARGAGATTPSPGAGAAAGAGSGAGAKPSGAGAKPSGAGSTPRPSTPKATPSSPSSVTCTSDSSCTIRKSVFDSMVSSPSKLESQAKIVPAIQNDVFSGYKLSWIRPGSEIAQMGFKSGDKITHVNGRDLTDDAEAFALYLSLSSTRAYKIKYLRGGQSRTKNVDVK